MATEQDHSLSQQASAKRAADSNYQPSLAELRAIDQVLIEQARERRAAREKQVRQMRANNRIEGFEPDAGDLAMQQRYIEGTASLDDLLQYAKGFATKR